MTLNRWFLSLLILTTACAATLSPTSSSLTTPEAASLSLADSQSVPDFANGTTLYISATMHIESALGSWPQDTDTFLSFLQQTTDAGIRWSIGGDIGWLTGDPRAKEIVTRSAAVGVQWDVHGHKDSDRGRIASTLASWGVTPTGVISGMLISEYNRIPRSYLSQGYRWTPTIVWGGVKCSGHKLGCDDSSIGIYRPKSSAQFTVHSATGKLIRVAGGDHQLATAENFVTRIASGQVTAPVIGFTIMVEPEALQIVNSEDGLDEILDFVSRMDGVDFVHWRTISETAQAWVQAGSVPVLIQ